MMCNQLQTFYSSISDQSGQAIRKVMTREVDDEKDKQQGKPKR